MSTLKLQGLEVAAGGFRLQANLELRSRVTGVFGPSGAGKTTLLESIAGLRVPLRGAIILGDRTLSDRTTRVHVPPEHRRIAYVPQDLALFPHLSVRDNLLYGAGFDREEFEHVVEEFQLGPLLDRAPAKLSGGEKQRVAIGRALATRPRLLLLDEPLANLDAELKERGLELFRRLRDRFATPVLYVAHDANEIVELCDEAILLRRGQVERQGPVRELFRPSQRVLWEALPPG